MGDYVLVTINGWDKYNPRKDVKHPSWFAFNNRILEDETFFDFTPEEFRAWVYILCKASQKSTGSPNISFAHAEQICKIKRTILVRTLSKLKAQNIVTYVDVTPTLRAREPTGQDRQDKTEQNNLDQANARSRPIFDFDSVYEKYPRKVGKQKGISRLKAHVHTQKDFEDVCLALDHYVEHCRTSQAERRFIKHFSTWVSEWRDWVDPATGSGANFSDPLAGQTFIEPELGDA